MNVTFINPTKICLNRHNPTNSQEKFDIIIEQHLLGQAFLLKGGEANGKFLFSRRYAVRDVHSRAADFREKEVTRPGWTPAGYF